MGVEVGDNDEGLFPNLAHSGTISGAFRIVAIKVTMKNDKTTITRPIIEKTSVRRALSSFSLSPPDIVQEMPPHIRNISARIMAIKNIMEIPKERMEPREISGLGTPGGTDISTGVPC